MNREQSNYFRALIFCFTAMLISINLLSAEEEDGFFGTVLSAKGEAYIIRGIIEFDLKIEDELKYEDEIETGDDGSIQLSFKSSFISIGPNTCFTISKEEENGKVITLIEIDCGEIRSKIIDLKPGEHYRVDSVNGSVLVTGTDFVTGVNPDNDALSVSVLHGSVKVGTEVDGNESSMSVTNMQSIGGIGVALNKPATLSTTDATKIRQKLPIPGDKNTGGSPLIAKVPSNDKLLNIANAIRSNSRINNVAISSTRPNTSSSTAKKEDEKSEDKSESSNSSTSETGTSAPASEVNIQPDSIINSIDVEQIASDISLPQVNQVSNQTTTVVDTKEQIVEQQVVRTLVTPSFSAPTNTD
jgi:hypothetical protein